MKYATTVCLLALLALIGQTKLVVYGPEELIDEFNSMKNTDVKSKSALLR